MGRMTVKRFLQHEDVIRWYKAKEGRKVWFRWSESVRVPNPWMLLKSPNWIGGGYYVADDENAEQRKKAIDLEVLGLTPTKSEDEVLVEKLVKAAYTTISEVKQSRLLDTLVSVLAKTHPKAAEEFRKLW